MDLSELIMNIQQLAPQLASTCCVINGAFMTLEDVEKMGYDEFLYRSKINMPLRLYKYFSNAENDKEGSKVNYSMIALKNNTVYMQSPSLFDDVYDSEINIDYYDYDIWCCSSDKEAIDDDGNARYLTIELEEYLGELKAYPENKEKPWLCKSVKNIASQSDIFEETSLVLPPSEIIKFFDLRLNVSDLSWETEDKEKIILCNNNRNSYYRDPIGGTAFIRKDYFDKYAKSHCIKYFAFAERLIPETGYADETSLHFEIKDGQIIKEIRNDGGHGSYNRVSNPLCDNCPHANVIETSQNESPEYDMEWLKNMLEEYGIEDDSDLIGDEEMLFICYPKCSTCQKAKKWLDEHNIKYTERHIVDANPTYDELKEWYGKSGLPLKKFFNTSGLLYKEMQLKDKLSTMSEEEQLQLLATNGMLVKRPLIVNGDTVLVGFKEAEWSEKLN